MNEVSLPALTGNSPVGILAAIGVERLLWELTDDPPLLHWDRSGLTAVLSGGRTTLDEVVADLQRVVCDVPEGSLLPGLPAGFPPPGAAPDKLRVPQRGCGRASLTGPVRWVRRSKIRYDAGWRAS